MDAMSGSNISLVTKLGLKKPTGIAIDYVAERIFWLDAARLQILMSDFDGGNFDTINFIHKKFVPQHVQIYEGTLFWSGINAVGKEAKVFRVGITGSDFEDEHGVKLEEEVVASFSRVTSFDVYHSHDVLRAKTRMRPTTRNCSGAAVALYGPGGLTCVCPKGTSQNGENCTGE